MNIHGERYADVNSFISYCEGLNVKTTGSELEHYERIGAMLPVARVVCPDEYVIRMYRHELEGDSDQSWLAEWPSLLKLGEQIIPSRFGYRDLSDEQLIHCFDREFEAGNNPYLSRPGGTSFRPWSEYVITIGDTPGKEIERSAAEHYYSYWQVHQLYFIRKFSGFYQGQHSIDALPKWLPEFGGKRHYFNALSFWATMYRREKGRTFANIEEKHGIRRLDGDEPSAHRERQRKLAEIVTERFCLDPQSLYRFLGQLVKIYEEYEQDERYKLADMLMRDIFACEILLNLLTEETREQMATHLGVYQQTFRHLSIATKERDYALMILNQGAQRCAGELRALGCSDWSFTEVDCNALLDYCQQEGLGILQHALSGMNAVGFDEYRQRYRRELRYTNLKNILTAYEYLLKNLGERSGQNVGGKTLTPAVSKVMCSEPWFGRFKSRRKGHTHGSSVEEFLGKLEKLLNDADLNDSLESFWARAFLVTCLARNMSVHSFPSDDRYYGDLFAPMLDAAIFATLHTWKLAERNGWNVQSQHQEEV